MFNFGYDVYTASIFNRSFWNQFGQFSKESQFDRHFEKPDTLEEMLDDDTIISEFRNQGQKLMEFMKPDQFKKLIDFIIIEPANDQDSKRAFRYPFYSCELLCCDNAKVMDSFFPKPEEHSEDEEVCEKNQETEESQNDETKQAQQQVSEEQQQADAEEDTADKTPNGPPLEVPPKEKIDLFNYLCSFVHKQQDLNLVLAGYFAKVFANLFQRKTEMIINEIYSEDEQTFIKDCLYHFSSRSIAELILKFIAFDKEMTLVNAEQFIQQRTQILTELINLLKTKGAVNFEIAANVQMIITEICQKAYSISKGKEIIQHLLSEQIFKELCNLSVHQVENEFYYYQINQNQQISIAASNCIFQLLQLTYQDDLRQQDTDENEALQINISWALQELNAALPLFKAKLEQVPNPQNQRAVRSLGQTKLKLIESIYLGIKLPSQIFKQTLVEISQIHIFLQAEIDIFATLNQLLAFYDQNNLYHITYHRIVTTIIEQDHTLLIENLFDKNQFVRIFNLSKSLKYLLLFSRQHKKDMRKGFLGFLTKLGKFLEDFSQKNPKIEKYTSTPEWSQFKKQYFKKAFSDAEMELGGLSGNRERIESEDQIDFSKDQVKKRFEDFLSSSKPNENQEEIEEIIQVGEENEQPAQTDFFSSFQSGEQKPSTNSDPFSNFGAFQTPSQQGQQLMHHASWEQIHQFQELEAKQEHDFWRVVHHKEFEDKTFAEFDQHL